MENKPKVLILALSGIGDALMFTPAIKLIRDSYPDAIIDALVMHAPVKEIYENLQLLNNIYYFDFLKQGAIKSLKFILGLRKKYNYSINVYPSNRKEYNIISFIIGAKWRGAISYLRRNFIEFGFLNNVTIKENDLLHNVEENINLTKKLLNIKSNSISNLIFNLKVEDLAFANSYIAENNFNDKLLIGMHAGCSLLKNHIKRRWEPEKFAELAKFLIENKNAVVLLFGGPDELVLNQYIKQLANSNNLIIVNTKNISQSAALIKKCNYFITNDSGLMHIAAAMNVFVIPIIGPTSLNYIKPWKCNYKAITLNLSCSPCFIYSPKPLSCYRTDVQFKCIKDLTVDYAIKEIEDVID